MDYDPERYSKTAYDTQGPAIRLLHILEQQFNRKSLSSSDRSGLILVDFGCGPGNTVKMISDKFPTASRIIGIDIDARMIDYAQRNSPSDKFTFVQKDLGSPWSEWPPELTNLAGQVDAIFSNYTLQWVNDQPESMAKNLFRLLKPGGLFVGDLLYCGDLTNACTNQEQVNWLRTKFNLPTEREFLSRYLFSFRDAGFNQIQLKYEETISIFPDQEYRDHFIKIPVYWYRKYLLPTTTTNGDCCNGDSSNDSSIEEIDAKIKELLINLRIKRVFPDPAGSGVNLAELKQLLWTITLFKDEE